MLAAFRKYVADNAAVAAIVGVRIYPTQIPQGEDLPAMTYQRVTTVHDYHLQGVTGRAVALVQWNCYAYTPAVAGQLAETLRLAVDGLRGWENGVLFQKVTIQGGERDMLQPPEEAGTTTVHGVSLDFSVVFREATPA